MCCNSLLFVCVEVENYHLGCVLTCNAGLFLVVLHMWSFRDDGDMEMWPMFFSLCKCLVSVMSKEVHKANLDDELSAQVRLAKGRIEAIGLVLGCLQCASNEML